jgi:uncharacterized protein YdeI (YjbR/CyaY-like superfamily)
MSKPIPTDLPMHAFPSAADFDVFMNDNHEKLPAFYLKLAKKSSGIPSVTADEAIEVGLCYGWIDGWGRGIDDDWYFKRYTPRRAKSIWSQKNVATVAKLSEAGRMRSAGLAAVESARKDGRWGRAYAGPATIEVPDDLAVALTSDDIASKFFGALNRSDRYSVLWRIETASPTARARRIQAMLELLARKAVPNQLSGKKTPSIEKKKRESATDAEACPKRKLTKRTPTPKGRTPATAIRKSKRVANATRHNSSPYNQGLVNDQNFGNA